MVNKIFGKHFKVFSVFVDTTANFIKLFSLRWIRTAHIHVFLLRSLFVLFGFFVCFSYVCLFVCLLLCVVSMLLLLLRHLSLFPCICTYLCLYGSAFCTTILLLLNISLETEILVYNLVLIIYFVLLFIYLFIYLFVVRRNILYICLHFVGLIICNIFLFLPFCLFFIITTA